MCYYVASRLGSGDPAVTPCSQVSEEHASMGSLQTNTEPPLCKHSKVERRQAAASGVSMERQLRPRRATHCELIRGRHSAGQATVAAVAKQALHGAGRRQELAQRPGTVACGQLWQGGVRADKRLAEVLAYLALHKLVSDPAAFCRAAGRA